VRDARNPIVTCVGEPSSGHETTDPDWYATARRARPVVVVGGGVAGLETARVALSRGHSPVHIVERDARLGGIAAVAGPHAALVEWLVAECERLGAVVHLGTDGAPIEPEAVVVQCTGSVPGQRSYDVEPGAVVLDVADVRRGRATVPTSGSIALHDPIGGPIAVALAEELGDRAVLVTPDQIAANELSRTGDLAPANVRLAQRGVCVEQRTLLRVVRPGEIEVEDRFTGARRSIACAALVDCGFRLPDDPLSGAVHQAGDCVAPRTVHEAILEARRVARSV
jgi:2,4-dienoyl-CoA reductase (NADPH2)